VNVVEVFCCKIFVILWHIDPLLGSGPRATMEVLLEAVFSMWSAPRLYHATDRVQFS
jgi:hypothetical protein